MLSFSNKHILILALVALGVSEAASDSCVPQAREPDESVSFAATEDDTAGAIISGFVEIKEHSKYSYVPLKLEKFEQIGHLEDHKSTTLKFVMDCAIVEMDLHLSTEGETYNGTATEIRVTFDDKTYTISEPVFQFSRSMRNGSPAMSVGWSPFYFVPRGLFNVNSKNINFKKIGFVLESKNVAYNYLNHVKNEVGYQASWY